jgi:hypothetical protein
VAGLPPKSLELISEPPQGLALPDFKSQKPLFAKWASPLAESGYLWIALDRTGRDGPYDRLFIDSNGNGRLNDETAEAARSTGTTWARFGPVKVAFAAKEQPVTCHLNFHFTGGNESPHLSVISGGWYEGTVTIGRKEKRYVLLDQNANGTFNDRSIDFKDCDLIQIAEEGKPDICLVGDFIGVDATLYRLEVARDGVEMNLSPAQGIRFGTVKQQQEMTELVAGGENGMLTLNLKKGRGKLPVGKYRVYQWVIERKDGTGDQWSLKGWSMGNPDVFEISPGSRASLALGEPILSGVDVRKTESGEYTIAHRFRGRSGEQIQLSKNGAGLRPPSIAIRNADGSYDRTFTFEFG